MVRLNLPVTGLAYWIYTSVSVSGGLGQRLQNAKQFFHIAKIDPDPLGVH